MLHVRFTFFTIRSFSFFVVFILFHFNVQCTSLTFSRAYNSFHPATYSRLKITKHTNFPAFFLFIVQLMWVFSCVRLSIHKRTIYKYKCKVFIVCNCSSGVFFLWLMFRSIFFVFSLSLPLSVAIFFCYLPIKSRCFLSTLFVLVVIIFARYGVNAGFLGYS